MKLSCPACNGDRFVVFQRIEVSSVNTLSIFPLASQFLMTPDERHKALVQCGDCAYKLSYNDIDRMNEGTYVVPEGEVKPQEEHSFDGAEVSESPIDPPSDYPGPSDINLPDPEIGDTTETLVSTTPEERSYDHPAGNLEESFAKQTLKDELGDTTEDLAGTAPETDVQKRMREEATKEEVIDETTANAMEHEAIQDRIDMEASKK